jgi:hypothetical protein
LLSKTLKKVFTYFDDTIIVSVQFQIDRLSIEHQREVETLCNQLQQLEDQLTSVTSRSKERIRQLESELERRNEELMTDTSRLQAEIK